jgi:hypothetical protein
MRAKAPYRPRTGPVDVARRPRLVPHRGRHGLSSSTSAGTSTSTWAATRTIRARCPSPVSTSCSQRRSRDRPWTQSSTTTALMSAPPTQRSDRTYRVGRTAWHPAARGGLRSQLLPMASADPDHGRRDTWPDGPSGAAIGLARAEHRRSDSSGLASRPVTRDPATLADEGRRAVYVQSQRRPTSPGHRTRRSWLRRGRPRTPPRCR